MHGAKAPPAKTDCPLKGKHVLIWPDHDEGWTRLLCQCHEHTSLYARLNYLTDQYLEIPQDKPEKWDAADAIHEGLDIQVFISSCVKTEQAAITAVPTYSVGHLLDDTSPMPGDLILPRILTPGGLLVFGGAPKVGKSDFLLSFLAHMAAGVTFLGMKPPATARVLSAGRDWLSLFARTPTKHGV